MASLKLEQQRQQLRAAAQAFGEGLRRWRRRNGWAQDTAEAWALAIDIPPIHPSQWSNLETNSMKNPGPALFLNFAEVNRRLSQQDYGAIHSRMLIDRVKGAQAVLHSDGEPWDAADWFACYIGLQPWPASMQPEPPPITAERAAEWSAALREQFQQTAQAAGLDPLEAAVGVMRHTDPEHGAHKSFQRLILGFGAYTPDEILLMWREELPSPADWLTAWRRELGLPPERLTPPWETPDA